MRVNGTNRVNDLIGQISKSIHSENNLKQMRKQEIYNRGEIWKAFLNAFCKIHGKKIDLYKDTIINIKVLFHYFLKEKKFFGCENLRRDISEPSFDKGLLIIGGYGLGKTDFFKVFEAVFKHHPGLRFKFFTAKGLVRDFEKCQTPLDKEEFFKNTERKLIFIDDISSEHEASNYGKRDIIEEILYNRYDCRLRTFVSCNYTTSDNCALRTLEDLGERYGSRVYDRLFEMFNIIEFKGKSYRV
jgi:DNA replication protein DnaC